LPKVPLLQICGKKSQTVGIPLTRVLTCHPKLLGVHYSFKCMQLAHRTLCIREGPEYRPFRDLRSVPKAGSPRHYSCSFQYRRAGIFYLLEIATGWLVPSACQKIPIQSSWYFPPQKILLAKNRFVQAGKGAENTKEKI